MTFAERKTRIAVVGAGYVGRAHIAALATSPTCELSAVVDISPGVRDSAAGTMVPCFASLAELLAGQAPDGIVLATPNQLHVSQALECMSAGVGILLEKPVATSVSEGMKLLAAAESAGAHILVGHHRAHSPIMAKACEIIRTGKLGRLVAMMGSATFMKPDQYFADSPWRREIGAGPILLNMIHEVHSLRMLCGEIAAVQVFASHAVRGFPVEDTVSINLRFASGALGSFMLSDTAACPRSWEQTSRENAAYPAYADEDCYVIAGTRGSLSVPTMRIKSYPDSAERSWWNPFDCGIVDLTGEDPIKLQMEHFGAVVRGESVPLVSLRDGLNNLRVTEAIVAAAATGCTVTVTTN